MADNTQDTLKALYPATAEGAWDEALFRTPPSIYRGAPFWAWNTRLDRDQLLRQLRVLQAMGFGGAHIHPRTGLATPYLGEEFMELVQACIRQARADGMYIWLYDEDRWPSGFAGGLVTREHRFRAKHLLLTTRSYAGSLEAPDLRSNAKATRNENGTLIARYHVTLVAGELVSYRRLAAEEPEPGGAVPGRTWYAYLEYAVPSPWWNNQTYVDTLDPAAIARFIAVTHERYAAVVGGEFGAVVPAIFTDEPQFIHKSLPQRSGDDADLFLPWTTGFAEGFRAACGEDILDTLPEILWELPKGRASRARYRYHDYLAERFAAAFADQIGSWCEGHGLRLTGHMMEEPTLFSQTHALGEAMRSLRSFHIPGIDMLCDRREYTTAKQAQSVAHQYARPGTMSELYGVTNWDFDFIAESLLPGLCPMEAAAAPQLKVGAMAYDVIVVPGLRTIRATTLERLEPFAAAGGTVLFVGEVPDLVDAIPSDRAQSLAVRCPHAPFSRARLLEALEPVREIDAQLPDGTATHTLMHQVRDDGTGRFLFLCNTDKRDGCDVELSMKGKWSVTLLETLDGSTRVCPARVDAGRTYLSWRFPANGSLLLHLQPAPATAEPCSERPTKAATWETCGHVEDPVTVVLSEPNVLLLDRAAYRLDDGPWLPEEEILRLDNRLRTTLNYPLRMAAIAQPWTEPVASTPHKADLRFRIQTDVNVSGPQLALEDAAIVCISLDGAEVERKITGWWVDEAIATVALPDLAPGVHELTLSVPFGRQSNLEWCYLLGDFGVQVVGRHTRVVAPVRELAFGDWTTQGLPFYAGNVTYCCRLDADGEHLAVRVPTFKAPLLAAELDGDRLGPIAFDPFRADLGVVAEGRHDLRLTAYGNRVNAFGPVHNADPAWTWFGPDAWRTEGDQWADEYQIKPMGILTAPRMERLSE